MRTAPKRSRLAGDESGFTLVELLVVVTIVGILLAVAVPSYLGYQRKATETTAESNLRTALPAVEAFHQDHETYDPASMTIEALRSYDQGIAPGLTVVSGSASTYCLRSTLGTTSVFKNGPGASVSTAACS